MADSTADVRMSSKGFIVGSGTILFDMTHGAISSVNLELTGDLAVSDLVAESVIPEMHVIQKIKLRSEF